MKAIISTLRSLAGVPGQALPERTRPVILDGMLARCEDISDDLYYGVPLDAREVASALGEVSTLLVAAAVELESEHPAIAAGLSALGRRCQRAARPFISDPVDSVLTGSAARVEASLTGIDVVSTLRVLVGQAP